MDKNENEITINESLDLLDLKPVSKRVLLSLTENSPSAVADIASRLNIPKSSIYDALSELVDKSLVTEYGDDGAKMFGISDNEQLARVHKKKIEDLQRAHSSLLSYIAGHNKNNVVARPKMKFYAGVLGIKQAFRDMSWKKEYKEAYLMWPTTDMVNTLGAEFLRQHSEPRLKYGIVVNVIEKESDRLIQKDNVKYDWLENSLEKRLNRIKYVPDNTDWQMSYWIYGDKCLFASGGAEQFAFTIHSKEFAHMMKMMWEQMWKVAKE